VRILFLTHRLPYAPNRGDRIRAYHVLRLLGHTHDVHLVSLIHDRDEMEHVKDLRNTVASVTGVRISRVRNLVSAALALPGSRPLTHVLLHSPRMRVILQQCVKETCPDVVVAYCTGMARYALEPPLAGLPFVLDMVDVDSEKWEALANTSAAPARWIYRREARSLRSFEREAVERASATLVVSERERVVLENISPGSNAIVVQNGVDVASFASASAPQTEPRVVFCGVFDYGPNEAGAEWMALKVWPLVRRLLPEARLSLVGMNPSRTVRALAGDPSIHVTGAVPDVRPYLWDASIAIAPIWVARGVQNKVLEAIAAGLPSVVTPPVFDGLPLPVRPACLVAADARSFADATISLLKESPDGRRRMARRADLSQLSWDTQLMPLLDLIDAARENAYGHKV
jgi:sugar transferase (PEP-CTERM/EpsH1 system associated)